MSDERPLKSGYVPGYEARKQLQREVEDVIAPHKKDVQMPPFTTGELIVMALVCCDGTSAGKGMTDEDILRWIVTSFKFYNARMHEEWLKLEFGAEDDEFVTAHYPETMSESFQFLLLSRGGVDDDDIRGMANMDLVVKGFFTTFYENEVPVIENKPDQPTEREDSPELARWYIINSQARMFLRNWLEPERKGHFDFFGLPAELRNRIYEDVLLYPLPGVQISSKLPPFVLKHMPNTSTENLTWQATYRNPRLTWAPITTPNRTAFLHVCKQAFQEAMPIYYGLNSFSLRTFEELALALQELSPERIRRLKSLHIQMPVSSERSMSKEKLRHMQLDILTVGVDETALEPRETAYARYYCLLRIAARTKKVKFYLDDWTGHDECETDESEDEESEDEESEDDESEDNESGNDEDEDDEDENDESDDDEGDDDEGDDNDGEDDESEGDSSEEEENEGKRICEEFEAWFVDALEAYKANRKRASSTARMATE